MKRTTLALCLALGLAGCAMNVTMMPRDSGKVYTGMVNTNGGGSGTMTVNLDGQACTGPIVRVASNATFGFANAFGSNSRGGTSSAFGTSFIGGDSFAKAILSCGNGKGIRCDVSGRMGKGGGICMDDAGKLYDVLMQM